MTNLKQIFDRMIKPEDEMSDDRLIWETVSTLINRFDLKQTDLVEIYIHKNQVYLSLYDKTHTLSFLGVRNIGKYGTVNYWIRPVIK